MSQPDPAIRRRLFQYLFRGTMFQRKSLRTNEKENHSAQLFTASLLFAQLRYFVLIIVELAARVEVEQLSVSPL